MSESWNVSRDLDDDDEMDERSRSTAAGKRSRTQQGPPADERSARTAPGKVTRTRRLERRSRGDDDATRDAPAASSAAPTASAAAAPVQASALPHLARIQASFGHHDLSGVRAPVGAVAAEAAAAMGQPTGDDLAFAGIPDLRLAAFRG